MPKQGYKTITVTDEFYGELESATNYQEGKKSIPKLLWVMLHRWKEPQGDAAKYFPTKEEVVDLVNDRLAQFKAEIGEQFNDHLREVAAERRV